MIQTIKNYCSLWCSFALCFGLLTGCAPQKQNEVQDMRIGIAVYDQGDTFISTIVQSIEQMAREQEIDRDMKITLSIVDGRGNQTVQLEQIDQFIAKGCDVICVNIVDRTAAAVLIDKAKASDVPLVFFNREPVSEDMARWEEAYYVGADGKDSGLLQGNIVRDIWEADQARVDKNDDNILQYVMLEGEPGHQDALLRTKYSVEALVDAEIRIEKLAGDTAGWNRGQATAKMSQWLDELDGTVEVVLANNDDMALGAIDAYLAEGYAIENLPVVVGVDAIPAALDALETGTMQGTVRNDGDGIAESMLQLAIALRTGEEPTEVVSLTGDGYVWLDYQAITD